MNRGVITISESGTVSMPTDTVWMTMKEIADMYNVFGCYVRKAVLTLTMRHPSWIFLFFGGRIVTFAPV